MSGNVSLKCVHEEQVSASSYRAEFLEFLNERLDQIEEENTFTMLDDITGAIFRNKSDILGRLTLSLVKKKYAHLLDQEFFRCPNCEKLMKARGEKVKRELETTVGKFDLFRPYFYCTKCHSGHYPLDKALGLSDSPKQYDIQGLEVWLSSELPFEASKEAYERCTGEKMSVHHLHQTTNQVARDIEILDVCPTRKEIEDKIAELSEGQFRRPVMMLAIDGAHVPTRPEPSAREGKRGKGEWKEAKGFRLYLIDSKQIVHLISWHQVQTDQELSQALSNVKEAGLIPEEKVRLCTIGDGAPWIWNRMGELFPTAKEVLDYFHCSEYLHALANSQYGKGTRAAQEWTEATLSRLFHNQVNNVLDEIKQMEPTSSEAKEKIKEVLRYLSKHKLRINYGKARRGGYHIGSGAIESSNKFIGHVRLKRSGAWWYPTNANNILKLRCAKYNGTYDRIIEDYKRKDRERIRNKTGKPNLVLIKNDR